MYVQLKLTGYLKIVLQIICNYVSYCSNNRHNCQLFSFGNLVAYCCLYLYIHIYNLLAHGVIAIFFQTITVHKWASSPYRYPY